MKTRLVHPALTSPTPHISSGIVCDGWIHLSGQGPLDMVTRKPVHGTIEEETALTFHNVSEILRTAGAGLDDIVKCTCYLADLADFPDFDAAYRKLFDSPLPPVRTTVGTSLLNSIRIEVDVVARVSDSHG